MASLTSRMEAVEKENSKLKKNLIVSMDKATSLKAKVKTLDDDLRVERKLTLDKNEQLLTTKEKLKTIAARSVEASKQLTSTTLYSLVGTSKASSFLEGIWLSILLGLTWRVWTWRRLIKRWRWTKLPNPQFPKVMPWRLLLTLRLVKILLLMLDLVT